MSSLAKAGDPVSTGIRDSKGKRRTGYPASAGDDELSAWRGLCRLKSVRPCQAERDDLLERGFHLRRRKQCQRVDRERGVMLGANDGILQCAVLRHQADGMVEIAIADFAALQ